MSHRTHAHRTVFGTYNGYCSCSGLLFFGDRDWVRARLREHEASFSTPKFTGFDGIPDWTEKDTEIASLKADLARMKDSADSWHDRYVDLHTEVWRAVVDIRRVKADRALRFSAEDVLSVLEERLRGWL